MRIHKFLAHAGVASRRRAEELVAAGQVLVNGIAARIGQIVDESQDDIRYQGKRLTQSQSIETYLVHKPRGVVSTVKDPEGRPTVRALVKSKARLYPVGRLDYDSEGLMLLTTDGDLAYRLTHPKFEVDKTYRVLVRGQVPEKVVGYLTQGVTIEGKKTAPARVQIVEAQPHNTWLDITIHEGRNRQIRKMCEAVGYPVLRLIRTHLGPYQLGDLKPGKSQRIDT